LGDYQFTGSFLPAASAPDWIPLRMHVR
jgi:hypothetical protein